MRPGEIIVAVLTNVGAFALFITVFFFTVGKSVEKQALEFQLGLIVETGLASSGWFAIPRNTTDALRDTILEDGFLPDMGDLDRATRDRNHDLLTRSFFIMVPVGSLLTGGGLAWVAWKEGRRDAARAALMTLAMLAAIALVEIAISYLISRRYLSISADTIKLHVLDLLLEKRGAMVEE